jgi:CDP-4-dehydro-6-deoxyglucose reductase, E3
LQNNKGKIKRSSFTQTTDCMTFTVTVHPSGSAFQASRNAPILGSAIQADVGLPYGCKEGACGSCKCKILQGRVIHGAHLVKALSEQEEQAGYILTCCAVPQTDVTLQARTVAGAGDFPPKKMPCRVISITKPAPDVAVLRLQLPVNDVLRYRPGQYIEFILPDGSRRSYSMANAAELGSDKPSIELHIRLLPGGLFSPRVFSDLKEKEILRMEGPFGSFFLRRASTKPIVFLASGTGFAPIKAIISQLKSEAQTRPAVLYWGARTRADLYDEDWIAQAVADNSWLRYVPVLSAALASDDWPGRIGLVHQAVLADLPDLSAHQVYACGAPVMVHAAQQDFLTLAGLPAEEFFADAFTSKADQCGVPACQV